LFSRYLRPFLVLSCLPLLAFTCTYVKRISIALPSKPDLDKNETSVAKKNYEAVLKVLEHWAGRHGLEKVDCRSYPVKAERFPDLCTAYGFDYKTRALVGPNIGRIVVSIFYDSQIEKMIIQLFEQDLFRARNPRKLRGSYRISYRRNLGKILFRLFRVSMAG